MVSEALGISPESAQLHLRTIRAGGEISFKGYGSSAAAMTSLDAARLLIAATGSDFAKDSLRVLHNYAKLQSLGAKKPRVSLEDFLARRIDNIRQGLFPPESDPHFWSVAGRHPEPGKRLFGSRPLAQNALQLIAPKGVMLDHLPRFAIVRWLDVAGNSMVQSFGPEHHAESMAQIHRADDVVWRYEKADFIQVRVVSRRALITIAKAL
ncbi:MAG: hypothetical protein KIT48_00380 [Pseudolabrys sp.]|nr:hypothetical protein [Pseudolabrys sp.]